MTRIPEDYIERCYAGWLGKLAGIRSGAPIEGWTYDKIREIYGEVDGYLADCRRFAADDDSNGPMIFIRALNDAVCSRDLTPQQIAETWLNYAPYEHGFYWWGGYGKSTEHTAYLNLRAGISAPRSGSIRQNGAAIAEQIGGQIFIDTWGLVCPGQPELAAEFAGKAASVSHDGNGVYGGQYVAAAIALAFTAEHLRDVVLGALAWIPEDCEYARVVRDVVRFYDEQPEKDWRAAFEYVRERWGYHRYPGTCHIIPNAAVMILAMMYGEEDFDRTINISTMCGWDTDCNSGNVGTILGVFCGLDGIDRRKWLEPINDRFMVSSVLGCLNAMDAPWCTAYLADLAYRLAGEEMPDRWKAFMNPEEPYDHFQLPGSTHGYRAILEESGVEATCFNDGAGALKIVVPELSPTQAVRVGKRTYYHPDDFDDNRYDPAFSPQVYPGQRITAVVEPLEACGLELYAAVYVRDRNRDAILEGPRVPLTPGSRTELSYEIPTRAHTLVDEIGVRIVAGADTGRGTRALAAWLKEVRVEGRPRYDIDFPWERMEVYSAMHREVSQFTYLKGVWALEDGHLAGSCADFGECYTGDIHWTDYDLEGSLTCLCEGECALNVRVQGAIRSYAVALKEGKMCIRKNENGYRTLAECSHPTRLGETYRLRVRVRGSEISVWEAGKLTLSVRDTDHPYLNGCVGCSVRDGARAYFDHFVIE